MKALYLGFVYIPKLGRIIAQNKFQQSEKKIDFNVCKGPYLIVTFSALFRGAGEDRRDQKPLQQSLAQCERDMDLVSELEENGGMVAHGGA